MGPWLRSTVVEEAGPQDSRRSARGHAPMVLGPRESRWAVMALRPAARRPDSRGQCDPHRWSRCCRRRVVGDSIRYGSQSPPSWHTSPPSPTFAKTISCGNFASGLSFEKVAISRPSQGVTRRAWVRSNGSALTSRSDPLFLARHDWSRFPSSWQGGRSSRRKTTRRGSAPR
jgi:hypothetical protein